jgi:mono/diheme cytochrome c family protein
VLRAALLLSLLSLPALAANPDNGAAAFATACARCHAATQVRTGETGPKVDRQNARPGAGPDITEALLARGYDWTRAFIQSPAKVRRDASCDTRQLPPAQLDDLMGYLVARVVPEEPSRKERLAKKLSEEQARASSSGTPTGRALRRGGKK